MALYAFRFLCCRDGYRWCCIPSLVHTVDTTQLLHYRLLLINGEVSRVKILLENVRLGTDSYEYCNYYPQSDATTLIIADSRIDAASDSYTSVKHYGVMVVETLCPGKGVSLRSLPSPLPLGPYFDVLEKVCL